jgi:molybdate transport system ATP-binding protein
MIGMTKRKAGGEKQRVALARALLASPRLLLLDEPLANLDAALKEKIIPYLRRIRDEFRLPMLYVTHDREEAHALCEEILVMNRGKIPAREKV